MLQDESTPDFLEEVVTLFFDDSEKLLENLSESLYVYSGPRSVSLPCWMMLYSSFKLGFYSNS